MRKLQKAMIAAAVAAGGLSAVGAGTAYAHGYGYDDAPKPTEHFRPYQECSPQTAAEGDLPVSVLGLSETFDTPCGQFNKAFTG